MKRNLLFILFLLFGFGLSAQLTIPDGLEASASTDDTNYDFDFHLPTKNDTGEELDVYWEIMLDADFPQEWETYVCDKNLCYTKWIRNCPENMVNDYALDEEFEWKIHVLPMGVAGEGTLCMRMFYPSATGDSIFVDHCIEFSVTTNDITELDLAQVSLYPNPTSDLFQVKSDEYVRNIGIYNVVGKKVEEMSHKTGQSHNIEHLNKGMYLVRLMDETGQIIKTMKLSKR